MTDGTGQRTLGELVDGCAAAAPGTAGLTVEAADGTVSSLTYAELAAATRRVAGGLAKLGVDFGDRVVVQLPNSVEAVLAWFGLARLGAIFVPSNVAHTASELSFIADRCGASLAVSRSDALPVLRRAGFRDGQIVVADGPGTAAGHRFSELLAAGEADPSRRVGPDDVVELVFTSGTTSEPKAAMITHTNALFSGRQKSEAMRVGADDCLLSALPVFHVNAQSAFLAALTARAPFVLLERFSASRFCERLAAHGATVTSLVGMQVRTLLRQEPAPSDCAHGVRRAWFALNVSDAERAAFERRFAIRLLNGYGLTEAYTSVTQAPLDGPDAWPSVGLPLPGREVKVVDESGAGVAPGVVGEIVVGGVPGQTIMAGYWDDPAATDAAIRDGWLRTGDFASIDERGFVFFVERKLNMIKRAGENVAAGEVERVLMEHPAVAEVAVVGVSDPIRDEAVKAFVVLIPGSSATVADLECHCSERLAGFKVPTEWALRDALPKTSIGKIERKLLRAESEDRVGAPG